MSITEHFRWKNNAIVFILIYFSTYWDRLGLCSESSNGTETEAGAELASPSSLGGGRWAYDRPKQ